MRVSWSLVWGHSVHFAKFSIPRFSKHCSSFNRFYYISTKFHTKYHNQWLIYAITFYGDLFLTLKILWHFEFFLNTGPYGAGNFKTLLLPQFSSDVSQTLWGHWATMVEYRLWLFLVIGQLLKILWHFEILSWGSMGKPKMWNISKAVNCRVNG